MEGALNCKVRSTRRCISHICQSQMCLGELEGAYATFAFGKCVWEHWKVRPPQRKALEGGYLALALANFRQSFN